MFGELRLVGRALAFQRQYFKLRRAGNHRNTLAFLHSKKLDGPLLVFWQAAVITEHAALGEYAEIIELCDSWDLTLAAAQRLRSANDRYLAAYVHWWRVTAGEKSGLAKASPEELQPLVQSIDLSKVIRAFKKMFPLTIHRSWSN